MMPLSLRLDGRVEWLCPHGVGHTIAVPRAAVEVVARTEVEQRRQAEMDAWFVHGCDGCCGAEDE